MIRAHRLALGIAAVVVGSFAAREARAQFPVAGQVNPGFGGGGFNQGFGGAAAVNQFGGVGGNQGFGAFGANQGFGGGVAGFSPGLRGGFSNQVGMNGPVGGSGYYAARPLTYNNLNGVGVMIDQTVFNRYNSATMPAVRRRNR
jgi:hypothetical protein